MPFALTVASSIVGAQIPSNAPSLSIFGPAGQTVIVTTRYYLAGQVSKTVTTRLELSSGETTVALETNHDGLRVYLAVPTSRHTSIALLDGKSQVDEAESLRAQTLSLSYGSIPKQDEFQPPRALLDLQERASASRFLTALANSATRDIVSQLPVANIEWQVLDAYCSAVNQELGAISAKAWQLDGWLSWEGSLGARVISGVSDFERGRCRFMLMELDGQLVDVQVASAEMPEDWFFGPSSLDEYVAKGESLARELIGGDALLAQALFSRKFHDEISVEKVQELSAALRKMYGSQITSVKFKRSSLGPYETQTRTKRLNIDHLLSLPDGQQVISSVTFIFPCGANVIGRGELASIQLRRTWRSLYPALVQTTRDALEMLFGKPTGEIPFDKTRAEDFVSLLHPDLAAHVPPQAIIDLSRHLAIEWQRLAEEPDWDLWQIQQAGNNLAAQGPIRVATGTIDVRADYSNGQLIGLTFLAPTFAVSTLDLLSDGAAAVEQGQQFWQKLFRREFSSAHQQLAQAFREQLTLEDFKTLLANSDLGQFPELKNIELDTARISNRLERSSPFAVSVFYIAQFADNSFQPLYCEFWERAGNFELIHFSNDYESTFPVDGHASVARLLKAFRSGEPQAVINLMPESDRGNIDPHVLAAFLKRLKNLLEDVPLPEHSSALHVYSPGNCEERLQANLLRNGSALQFQATLQYGYLKTFYFTAAEMQTFAQELENIAGLENRGYEFLRQWMSRTGAQPAVEMMVSDLQHKSVVARLEKLRDQLREKHGPFLLPALTEWTASEHDNLVHCLFDLEFENALVQAEIVFELTAFGGNVITFQIVGESPQ